MKQLNTPSGVALLTLFIVFALLHHFVPSLDELRLFMNSLMVAMAVGLIRYLTKPTLSAPKTHPDLPKKAMRELQESLHHSQMTLYLVIMQPMLAASFPVLAKEVIGVKINDEPYTRFDEKMKLMKRTFRQLAEGRMLYIKRAFEDRDRALTMLVFLRLLWQEKPVTSLPTLFNKIPTALYPMLRGEAHRLFDLPMLFSEGRLLINVAEVRALSSIPGFYSSPEKHEIKTEELLSDKQQEINHPVIEAPPVTEVLELVIERMPDCLPDFLNWLAKRINSGNKQFSLESQELVLCNASQFDANTVFILPEVRAKYQSRSGVSVDVLENTLTAAFPIKKTFQIERDGRLLDVLPCCLDESFTTNCSTLIIEGSEK